MSDKRIGHVTNMGRTCYCCGVIFHDTDTMALFCESCDERISLKLECLAEKRPLAIVIYEIREELRAGRY